MNKYLAKAWTYPSPKIETIEITRETKASYWIDCRGREQMWRKETEDEKCCDTFEEAKEFLVKTWNYKISEARKAENDLNSTLDKILKLVEGE